MIEIQLIFYLLKIHWCYTAANHIHKEDMLVTVYCGSEDVTDDIEDSDWEVIQRLCYADKESEDTWVCDLWDSMKEQLEPFYSSGGLGI